MAVDLSQMSTCSFIKIRTRNGNFKYTITIYIDGDHSIWWHFTRLHVVILSVCLLHVFQFSYLCWKQQKSTWDHSEKKKKRTKREKKNHWNSTAFKMCTAIAKTQTRTRTMLSLSFMCQKQKFISLIQFYSLNCSCITDSVNWMHIFNSTESFSKTDEWMLNSNVM